MKLGRGIVSTGLGLECYNFNKDLKEMRVQNIKIPSGNLLQALRVGDMRVLTLEHSWGRARSSMWPEPSEPEGEAELPEVLGADLLGLVCNYKGIGFNLGDRECHW